MPILAEPRRKTRWSLNPRGIANESKFGKELLEKMGWSEGQGLGAEKQGIVDPITLKFKNDSKGLGFAGPAEAVLAHQEDFETLLQSLKEAHHDGVREPGVSAPAGAGSSSSSTTTSGLRNRHRYHKFRRAKDTSNYSAKDLECIVGKANERLEAKKVAAAAEDDPDDFRPNFRHVEPIDNESSDLQAAEAATEAKGMITKKKTNKESAVDKVTDNRSIIWSETPPESSGKGSGGDRKKAKKRSDSKNVDADLADDKPLKLEPLEVVAQLDGKNGRKKAKKGLGAAGTDDASINDVSENTPGTAVEPSDRSKRKRAKKESDSKGVGATITDDQPVNSEEPLEMAAQPDGKNKRKKTKDEKISASLLKKSPVMAAEPSFKGKRTKIESDLKNDDAASGMNGLVGSDPSEAVVPPSRKNSRKMVNNVKADVITDHASKNNMPEDSPKSAVEPIDRRKRKKGKVDQAEDLLQIEPEVELKAKKNKKEARDQASSAQRSFKGAEDGSQDEAVKFIERTESVQEYFARKMAEMKAKSESNSSPSLLDNSKIGEQSTAFSGKGKRTKQREDHKNEPQKSMYNAESKEINQHCENEKFVVRTESVQEYFVRRMTEVEAAKKAHQPDPVEPALIGEVHSTLSSSLQSKSKKKRIREPSLCEDKLSDKDNGGIQSKACRKKRRLAEVDDKDEAPQQMKRSKKPKKDSSKSETEAEVEEIEKPSSPDAVSKDSSLEAKIIKRSKKGSFKPESAAELQELKQQSRPDVERSVFYPEMKAKKGTKNLKKTASNSGVEAEVQIIKEESELYAVKKDSSPEQKSKKGGKKSKKTALNSGPETEVQMITKESELDALNKVYYSREQKTKKDSKNAKKAELDSGLEVKVQMIKVEEQKTEKDKKKSKKDASNLGPETQVQRIKEKSELDATNKVSPLKQEMKKARKKSKKVESNSGPEAEVKEIKEESIPCVEDMAPSLEAQKTKRDKRMKKSTENGEQSIRKDDDADDDQSDKVAKVTGFKGTNILTIQGYGAKYRSS